MRSIDYFIESFHPEAYRGRANELVLAGWLYAEPPPLRMTLEVDGDPPRTFPISELHLPSPDVADRFGRSGAASRFHAVVELPQTPLALDRARLLVEFERGQIRIEVGSLYAALFFNEPSAADLVSRCESLGDNCEFGFMQRRLGVNQLGLFRFSGSFSGHEIARAIAEKFEGFAEFEDLEAGPHHGEWVIKSRKYGFTLHTGRFPHMISEGEIREKEGQKLRYLVRKFFEDIADANKLFVRRVRDGDLLEGMHEVHAAMRAHGPTRMLWVNPATEENPHGTLREVEDGLFHGFIGQLAPKDDAFNVRADLWLDLLRRVPGLV